MKTVVNILLLLFLCFCMDMAVIHFVESIDPQIKVDLALKSVNGSMSDQGELRTYSRLSYWVPIVLGLVNILTFWVYFKSTDKTN